MDWLVDLHDTFIGTVSLQSVLHNKRHLKPIHGDWDAVTHQAKSPLVLGRTKHKGLLQPLLGNWLVLIANVEGSIRRIGEGEPMIREQA